MKRFAYLTVTGLLAAGVIAGSAASANASSDPSCTATATGEGTPTCAASVQANGPITVTVTITTSPNKQAVTSTWGSLCLEGGQLVNGTPGSFTGTSPVSRTISVTLPSTGFCTLAVAAGFINNGTVRLSLSFRPGLAPAAPEIKGYAHLCVDDAGNSSTAGNKVELWSCYGGAAEQWSFSRGELLHRGMCLTDKAAKAVLNKCDGASAELWTHNSRGEYVLKAHGGTLCLDDPAYAKRNGTQLVVYTCHGTANQRWTLP